MGNDANWTAVSNNDLSVVFGGDLVAADPSVIYDGEVYRMAYTDLDPVTQKTVIAYAESTDGETWRALGGYDAPAHELSSCETAEIVDFNGERLLFMSRYDAAQSGFGAEIFAYRVGADNALIPLSSEPVIATEAGWFDSDAAYSPAIVADEAGLTMFYVGHNYFSGDASTGVTLLRATSRDGVTWEKDQSPVLRPGDGPAWASDGFAEPSVAVDEAGRVHLFFTALQGEERVIGYAVAESLDASFSVMDEPLLRPADLGSGVAQLLAPTAVLKDGAVDLWFTAYGVDGSYQIAHAGATLEAPDAPAEPEPLELVGGRGDDILQGGDGDDLIKGRKGDDRLEGGDGDDVIRGGRGQDRIEGGADDDLLTGGRDADTFVFASGFGHDRITDFDKSLDIVELRLTEEDFAQMQGFDLGDAVRLSFGDQSITFDGLEIDDLGLLNYVIL